MTEFAFEPLPSVEDGHLFQLLELDSVENILRIPSLPERPQDPIMDGLRLDERLRQASLHYESKQGKDSHVVPVPALDWLDPSVIDWTTLCSMTSKPQDQCLSWDTLRPSSEAFAALGSSSFWTEQPDFVVAAGRHFAKPNYNDDSCVRVHVTQVELLPSLKALALGTATSVHQWDESSQSFLLAAGKDKAPARIVIDGIDEISGDSLVKQFVELGNSLRRLEHAVDAIRSRARHEEHSAPTLHAFSHGLSTILTFVRRLISRIAVPAFDGTQPLLGYWSDFSLPYEIAMAVSTLKDCSGGPSSTSASAPSNTSNLLSEIWQQLCTLRDRDAHPSVVGCLAYLLTVASRPYINGLCESLGFTSHSSSSVTHTGAPIAFQGDHGLNDEESFTEGPSFSSQQFPDFIPPRLVDQLPRAQRSLRLLRAADPNHHLLHSPVQRPDVAWLWTPEDIHSAWNLSRYASMQPDPTPVASARLEQSASRAYRPELSEFQRFDLAPDAPQPPGSSNLPAEDVDTLESLVARFPAQLPLLTPTLPALAELVFDPIAQQTALLADSLLRVFLAADSPLYLPAHLALLRSYMLITSPAFKDRLELALFSHAGEPQGTLSGTLRHAGRARAANGVPTAHTWAVGLAHDLADDQTWPPSGSDFSYHLRTVVNDSLPITFAEVGEKDTRKIWQEAETRLGFALRELPVKTGREGWLNPLSLEALDSVYLTYQVPHPLDVLLPTDVLSKYQRVFTFLLRLTRAESVCRALYRMTRSASEPLFPTLNRHRALLDLARFGVHTFVSALAAYAYDTAVRRQFDAFLADVATHAAHALGTTGTDSRFADVFALAEYHSAVLDDVLSACLLRSNQRAAGARVQRCLELVLELSVLMGRRRLGHIEEYQAAPELEAVWQKFQTEKRRLIEVLKSTVDKDKGSTHASLLGASAASAGGAATGSGNVMLQDLLLRLGSEVGDSARS